MEATKKVYLVYHAHFDAAHYLRNYKGKCANTHGHRWEVLVKISGRLEDQPDGILIDFKDFKRLVDNVLPDHLFINNDVPEFKHKSPSAENLAVYIYKQLSMSLTIPSNPKEIRLEDVTVYENPNCCAIYKGE